jgi:glycosyltransferase involved in cell wall biosynthesis
MDHLQEIRIYIHYKTTREPWGGGNNFLRELADAMGRHGGVLIEDINEPHEIFLYNSGYEGIGRFLDLGVVRNICEIGRTSFFLRHIPSALLGLSSDLLHLPRKEPKLLVHRLNGVGKLYGRPGSRMDELQALGNRYADHTIFQSEFSRLAFQEIGVSPSNYTTIGNGANRDVFHIGEKEDISYSEGGPIRFAACSWSSHRMKGFEKLVRLAEEPNVSVTFIGRWPADVDCGEVKCLGRMRQEQLADVMRQSDAFVHASENDTCPNVVYEALCSGLPVLYLNSGGTPEIVGPHGLPLSEPFSECVERFRKMLPELRERLLSDRYRFSIDRACEEYMSLFRRLLADGRQSAM